MEYHILMEYELIVACMYEVLGQAEFEIPLQAKMCFLSPQWKFRDNCLPCHALRFNRMAIIACARLL